MNITKDCFVEFHYALVDDAEVKDGSRNDEPLTYVHGYSMLVPGLEQALEGHATGDHFQVQVAPDQGYGERDEELFEVVPREAFADLPGLRKGMLVNLEDHEGESQLGLVAELDNVQVRVDLNHPFAGQTLNFDVEVVSVRQATADELEELASQD